MVVCFCCWFIFYNVVFKCTLLKLVYCCGNLLYHCSSDVKSQMVLFGLSLFMLIILDREQLLLGISNITSLWIDSTCFLISHTTRLHIWLCCPSNNIFFTTGNQFSTLWRYSTSFRPTKVQSTWVNREYI